ncbi:MAG: hypothetical protein GX988_01645 [Clostridiales bacterium]|nr:hypothetical protein [Clostridiales bacterium]
MKKAAFFTLSTLRKFTLCIILIVLSLLILTSCKNKDNPPPPDLNRGFTCNADITYGDLTATAEIARTGAGVWDLKFTSPTNLKDITLSYSEGDVKVGYKGFSFSMPESSLPVKAIASSIIGAIDNAATQSGIEVKSSGDDVIVNGKSDVGNYILTIDPKDDTVISVAIPDIDLSVKFDSFVFN